MRLSPELSMNGSVKIRYYLLGGLLLITLLLVCVFACFQLFSSHKTSPYSYVIKTESVHAEFLSADASYPQIQGMEAISIQNAINQRIESGVHSSPPKSANPPPGCEPTSMNCVIFRHQNAIVSELTRKYLSIQLGSYEDFPGSSHPSHNGYSLNFDLETGNELQLDDFFLLNSNYLQVISGKIRGDLIKQLSHAPSEMIIDGTQPDGAHFLDFVLTEKGFLFLFDDYEVAPYVYGNPGVLIPYDELANILIPSFRQEIETFTPSPLINPRAGGDGS